MRGIIRRPYNKSKYCWCFCTQHPFSPSLFSLTRATFVAIFCCSILVLFSCSCLAPLLFLFFPSWNFLLLLEFIFKNSSFIIWQRKMDAKWCLWNSELDEFAQSRRIKYGRCPAMFKCTASRVSIKQPYSPFNQQPKILESPGAGVSKSHGRSRKILGKMTNFIKAFQTIIFF